MVFGQAYLVNIVALRVPKVAKENFDKTIKMVLTAFDVWPREYHPIGS